MKDHHNYNRSIADDRPDSDDWDWEWFSDLPEGVQSNWGLHTVKKFDDINLAARNDHPGIFRRIINLITDG